MFIQLVLPAQMTPVLATPETACCLSDYQTAWAGPMCAGWDGFSGWAEVESSGAVCDVSMYSLHAFVRVLTCIRTVCTIIICKYLIMKNWYSY